MSASTRTALLTSLLAGALLSGCNTTDPDRSNTGPFRPQDLPAGPQVEAPPPSTAPETSELEQLLARAKSELAAGNAADAEITLWQVKHRDPMHLEANELYQDLRLKSRSKSHVYAEYRQLLADNPESLAALYLTMRPILLRWSAPKPTGEMLRQVRASDDEYRGPFPAGDRISASDPDPAATAAFMHSRELRKQGEPKQALQELGKIKTANPPRTLVEVLRQDLELEIASGRRPAADPLFMSKPPEVAWVEMLERAKVILNAGDGIGDARALYERLARLEDAQQSSLRLATDVLGGFSSWWGVATMAETICQRALSAEGREQEAGLRLAILLADSCILSVAVYDHSPWLVRSLSHGALGNHEQAAQDMRMAQNLAAGHDPRIQDETTE